MTITNKISELIKVKNTLYNKVTSGQSRLLPFSYFLKFLKLKKILVSLSHKANIRLGFMKMASFW